MQRIGGRATVIVSVVTTYCTVCNHPRRQNRRVNKVQTQNDIPDQNIKPTIYVHETPRTVALGIVRKISPGVDRTVHISQICVLVWLVFLLCFVMINKWKYCRIKARNANICIDCICCFWLMGLNISSNTHILASSPCCEALPTQIPSVCISFANSNFMSYYFPHVTIEDYTRVIYKPHSCLLNKQSLP